MMVIVMVAGWLGLDIHILALEVLEVIRVLLHVVVLVVVCTR